MGRTTNIVMNGIAQGIANYLNKRLSDKYEERDYEKKRKRRMYDTEDELAVKNYKINNDSEERSRYNASISKNDASTLKSRAEANRSQIELDNQDKVAEAITNELDNQAKTSKINNQDLNFALDNVNLRKNVYKSGLQSKYDKNIADSSQSKWNQAYSKMKTDNIGLYNAVDRALNGNKLLELQMEGPNIPLRSQAEASDLKSRMLRNAFENEFLPLSYKNKALDAKNKNIQNEIANAILSDPSNRKALEEQYKLSLLSNGNTGGEGSSPRAGGKKDSGMKDIVDFLGALNERTKLNLNPNAGLNDSQFIDPDLQKNLDRQIGDLIEAGMQIPYPTSQGLNFADFINGAYSQQQQPQGNNMIMNLLSLIGNGILNGNRNNSSKFQKVTPGEIARTR